MRELGSEQREGKLTRRHAAVVALQTEPLEHVLRAPFATLTGLLHRWDSIIRSRVFPGEKQVEDARGVVRLDVEVARESDVHLRITDEHQILVRPSDRRNGVSGVDGAVLLDLIVADDLDVEAQLAGVNAEHAPETRLREHLLEDLLLRAPQQRHPVNHARPVRV